MKLFYPKWIFASLIIFCTALNATAAHHLQQKGKTSNERRSILPVREIYSNSQFFFNEAKFTETEKNSTIRSNESTLNLIEHRVFVQEECDTIILNDGKLIKVKIINSTQNLVNYTKCDDSDTTQYTLIKDEIKAIQYANGKFEFVKHKSAAETFREEQVVIKEEKETAKRTEKIFNNAIYGSLGYALIAGSGTIYYERMLKQNRLENNISFFTKIGIGQAVFWDADGKYILGQLGVLTGNKNSHFETSLGMVYFYGGSEKNWHQNNPLTLLSGSVGYRYQKPSSRFIFRAGAAWPEMVYLSIGVRF
jgi:hypothetical protein